MTMWSNASPLTEAIDSIARAVLAIVRTHPVRVLIDGRSAAGKTTFSNALARRLVAVGKEVVVAEFDEFHPTGSCLSMAAFWRSRASEHPGTS